MLGEGPDGPEHGGEGEEGRHGHRHPGGVVASH